MVSRRRLIIIIVLLCSFISMKAQYKLAIYNAYITNEMVDWKVVIDEMEAQEGKSEEFLLELINYQYGYIGWCIDNNKKREAKTYKKLAENNLAQLEKTSLYQSYVDAYQSAFYGFAMELNRFKIPFFARKCLYTAKRSMDENPYNPYGYIQYANAKYHLPRFFGGSKSEALKYYKLAKDIMEKDTSQIKHDWNYVNLLAKMAELSLDMNESVKDIDLKEVE